MTEIRFEEPPRPYLKDRANHREAAAKLRERPTEWAIVSVCASSGSASSLARAIRIGQSHAWQPRGEFEAVARKVEGEHRVYARYVPSGDDDD
jgi:hypothetical protein